MSLQDRTSQSPHRCDTIWAPLVLPAFSASQASHAFSCIIDELSRSHPGRDEFTDLIRAAADNGAGFVVGWLYRYLWIVVIAVEAVAGATLLHAWMAPSIAQWSILLLLLMMSINCMSAGSFGKFEFWFSSVKVAASLTFVLAAAIYCFGSQALRSQSAFNLVEHHGFAPNGWRAVLAGVVTVFSH